MDNLKNTQDNDRRADSTSSSCEINTPIDSSMDSSSSSINRNINYCNDSIDSNHLMRNYMSAQKSSDRFRNTYE